MGKQSRVVEFSLIATLVPIRYQSALMERVLRRFATLTQKPSYLSFARRSTTSEYLWRQFGTYLAALNESVRAITETMKREAIKEGIRRNERLKTTPKQD